MIILTDDIYQYCINAGYTIQLARKEEIDDILNLYKERTAWFKEKGINQWQKYLEHHNKNEFLDAINQKQFFLICQNNTILACFEISEESKLWNENNNDSYYIYKIVTKVDIKNLGKLIFDICEKIAKSNNKKYLKIDCLKRNLKLNEIYNSHDFKFVKTDTQDYYTFNLRKRTVK